MLELEDTRRSLSSTATLYLRDLENHWRNERNRRLLEALNPAQPRRTYERERVRLA